MAETKRYDLEKLRELRARLERSMPIDRSTDASLHDFFGFTREDHCRDWRRQDGRSYSPLSREQYLAAWAKPFTTSRDAAHALLERVLPEHGCVEGKGRLRPDEPLYGAVIYADLSVGRELGAAEGDIPARVLCLAVVRALIAKEETRAA